MIEHDDILIEVKKERYAKPVNLLYGTFDKESGRVTVPPHIEQLENFIKDLRQHDSERAELVDEEKPSGKRALKTQVVKERKGKLVSTAKRKYLYFLDSFEREVDSNKIRNKQDHPSVDSMSG